ncbi:MAG: CRISPR-associated helicase Cas3' [candidate division Zixibacteria bacterium]|nr:CRISPR-associated helicase Cas3' [candidate division Zixibacteria bacterium]
MNDKSKKYLSHSTSRSGRAGNLDEHLQSVARRAAEFAESFRASEEAHLAGLFHDLGKYGDLFQRRLEGKERGIDHWSAGAWTALSLYQYGIASALTIQGHHIGLQKADKDSLKELDLSAIATNHPLGLRLSEPDLEILKKRLKYDGIDFPKQLDQSILDYRNRGNMLASAMLDVRMLYSALVDADFIETEAHFNANLDKNKYYRKCGPELEPDHAFSVVNSYIDALAKKSTASIAVNKLRNDLLTACLEAAEHPQGAFTLTAPTGSGKTLSMLAFALRHAVVHNLRRIVIVIPFLSIIEQTVKEYRKIFDNQFAKDFVLEHHSLSGAHGEPLQYKDEGIYRSGLLAENWDAPIVVTTSVQMLESLFANRPSACRKLHRLANSIILFDEVQTIPTQITIPTLATLSRLTERYGSTVVFATATQPAFSHLDTAVLEYCHKSWQPEEIVPQKLNLFSRSRRTRIQWPDDLKHKTSWNELSNQLNQHQQVLCIVNLKRHAHQLYDLLVTDDADSLFHLSTNMCPAHREVTMQEIRSRLNEGKPCRLISTQCIEAGVDVDFPVVYRALAPMDAIAQAAGRCNRNGLAEKGIVTVFEPEDKRLYPSGAYEQAASVTRLILKQESEHHPDINDPELFTRFYRELYSFSDPQNMNKELQNAIKGMDFEDVAKRYKVINKPTINVLVPYDIDIYKRLQSEVEQTGLTREWIAKARPYTIGLYRPGKHENYLDRVPLHRQSSYDGFADDWYIYIEKEHYDSKMGLITPNEDLLIA